MAYGQSMRRSKEANVGPLFKSLLAQDPKEVKAYYNRAVVYLKTMETNRAVAEAAAAVQLSMESSKAHERLGSACAKMGQYDDAEKALAAWWALRRPQWRFRDIRDEGLEVRQEPLAKSFTTCQCGFQVAANGLLILATRRWGEYTSVCYLCAFPLTPWR
jgi:tetratricopeptide (TPR) repeat protein